MYKLGYSVTDLIQLIKGCFGVGYLDAIMNSAIDADKIDYIFRDTDSVGKKITLDPIEFLKDFTMHLEITPEKFLVIKGMSAKSAVELLHARKFLYEDLYRKPGIIVLEGLVKLIIKTYFVHIVELSNNELKDKLKLDMVTFPDLGHYKIIFCADKMEDLLKDIKDDIEYNILKKMVEELTEMPLNENLKTCINNAFRKISDTSDEEALKKLESNMDFLHFPDQKGEKEKIGQKIKDCMLRKPGSILIDLDRTVNFLSIADDRDKKERSDGTMTFSECILVPSGEHKTWHTAHKTHPLISLLDSSLVKFIKEDERRIWVYFYPITGEQNFNEAKNLFDKLP